MLRQSVSWRRRSSSPLTRRVVRPISTEAASHASNQTQVYVSRARDPFLNLSIEHHLLQVTPPESTVLFLYTNSPCVVFGRNQNPWLEVNLSRLARIRDKPESLGWKHQPIQLVRRRSGGGTVFHDEGNVNFSVTCPPAAFDRNKHAEMVVRALRGLGKTTTRVNERHDIVMDGVENGQVFKISGSAYKLTRLRSLHHGTCLLQSPNLADISGLLRSPAEPFIKARGVDSVRSPVANVGIDTASFHDAVLEEFRGMYGEPDIHEEVDDSALDHPKIMEGYKELQSRSWIYGQTPRFTFCTHPHEQDPRQRPSLPFPFELHFEARHGVIEQFGVRGARLANPGADMSQLVKATLQEVSNWDERLKQSGMDASDAETLGTWMDGTMGTPFTTTL